ncbi:MULTISPECIES: sigma-54 dependent transcriptional regulator [unclassified Pseudoalteromonas]|uniref:sigma-54-dependent transcriptional regulator n=1 Tax=unclassified Pseudoalteromonas TaxID=194690 RepID=UPI001F37D35A|nr:MULTISPECIES: sigma-54 dependent transcriptional regulator [unclassified Pseudoalteromonas]MDP2633542.1 sigma-54 dependent transcriptional regulator [Pseudoalteromonas sp. 1_MG-2023]
MAAHAAIKTTMIPHTILIVDDDDDIRFALSMLLEQAGYRVVEADGPTQCMQLLGRLTPALVLLDMNFTRDTTSGKEGLALLEQITPLGIPIMLMTAWANIELAVTGLQKGAKDFIEKPWRKEKLLNQIANHINPITTTPTQGDWIACSLAMQSLDTLITQLAPTDANLLILGENGTGKSQLAKRIHQLSTRNQAPFVSLNMGAIAESLFESELFGHHKGAFTDAKQDRIGAFSRAKSGTLFMDEIGTLPVHLQPKLLQVLETGEFTPLGANASEQVNVRLIAATNQDLYKAITDGQFRQDLYYRLNTFVIRLPALRERKDDILPLATHFINHFAAKYNKPPCTLSQNVEELLCSHGWPGNIRELSHVIERAMLMCTGSIIELSQIMLDSQTNQNQSIPKLTLEELEKQRITDALKQHNHQITAAAKSLGISRNALYRRMEKYQLEGLDE